MKIQIGYHFDGGCFPDELNESNAAEGVIKTGPLGLLSILETRLGIAKEHCSHSVRIAHYHCAMSECCEAGQPFYKQSFEADGWSSAKKILSLRDQLRLSGWDGSDPKGSKRLTDLAKLEGMTSVLPGLAERIDAVLYLLGRYGISGISELQLHGHNPEQWPACWRNLFWELEKQKVSLNVVSLETAATTVTDLQMLQRSLFRPGANLDAFQADGSIIRMDASTALEAAEALSAWLAADENKTDSIAIIAESGREILGSAMHRHGLPRLSGGNRSQWRSAIQLLPLALNIHWGPFDPQRYLEFLTSPVCPLPSKMAEILVRALEKAPGVGGKQWHQAIAACQEWGQAQKDGKAYLESLKFWTEIQHVAPHAGLETETIRCVCLLLGEWARKKAYVNDVGLMVALSNMALELAETVRATGLEAIPKPQLDRMLDSVIGGGSVSADQAEAAPWAVLGHPGQLGGTIETVVWWNFNSEGIQSNRAFWTNGEKEALSTAGVCMDDYELERYLECSSWTQAVCCASTRLVLVMPRQDCAEEIQPHPLWENIVAAMNLSEERDIPAMTVTAAQLRQGEGSFLQRDIPLAPVPPNLPLQFQAHWLAPQGAIARRDKESPSGMSQLIKCPFAWVLNYVLKVRPAAIPKLPEGNQLLGSFCHSIVEELISKSSHWTPQAAADRAMAIFDSRLNEMAATLLLPGMETEQEKLRDKLERAVSDIFERIQNAKLMILESERSVERTDDIGQTYQGYIDLSMEDAQGNPVVWDLKWSNRSKYRREELQKGCALQLAAYCWMLDNDNLPTFGAYYMLAQTELISSQAPWLPPKDIEDSDLKSTWTLMCKAYDSIHEKLQEGEVEAIGIGTNKDEAEIDLGRLCKFCDYTMICGAGYE